MKKKIKENITNALSLSLLWVAWLSWMLWSPQHFSLLTVIFFTLMINLIFLQALSGVVHEAAHTHFIQGNKRYNDFFGNWLAAYMFLYGLNSYRAGHFEHHRTKVFFIPEDGETAPNMAKTVNFSGFLHDLCGITALKMFFFRTKKNSLNSTVKSDSSWPKLIGYFLVLWSLVAYFGSPLMPVLYVFTMVTIYPFSNRIRLWGTHADIVEKGGLFESTVARNVKSPWWERIFFGNRMMMYHYEHHVTPSLTFRECEARAYSRVTDDLNITAPSYWFCIKRLLRINKVSSNYTPCHSRAGGNDTT